MSSPSSWTYFKVYVADLADLDRALRVVEALPRRASEGVSSWHFLRFTDGGGPHLRLRLQVRDEAFADVYQATRRRLLDWSLSSPERGGRRREDPVLPASVRWQPAERSARAVQEDVYEPELRKYGGEEGVRRAEGVFHASSELVLGAWSRATSPAALALALMRAAGAVLPAESRRRFWHDYAGYWVAFGQDPARRAQELAALAADRGDAARAAADEAIGLAAAEAWPVAGYLGRLSAALGAAPATGLASASHQLFQLVHLTNNRLGMMPLEESYLARVLADAEVACPSSRR